MAQAKKISEIHAAAQAELGMVVPGLLPALAALPALPGVIAPGQAKDVELFPAFKGGGAVNIGYRVPSGRAGAGRGAVLHMQGRPCRKSDKGLSGMLSS